MSDKINDMTSAQRDALADRALKNQRKARERAKEFRDRKREKGLVQVSIWVPAEKAETYKKMFERKVSDDMKPQSE